MGFDPSVGFYYEPSPIFTLVMIFLLAFSLAAISVLICNGVNYLFEVRMKQLQELFFDEVGV